MSARDQLIQLYRAAVAGANVESSTCNAVAAVPWERRHRVWIFAFGKAANGMAAAAVGTLQRSLVDVVGGVVVAPEPGEAPCSTVTALTGDHPLPGPRSFGAAAQIGRVIARKRGADVGLVLLSGGTSSLIAAPLRGIAEQEIAGLYDLLLGSGLGIGEMNAVRKRVTLWGGGRMALALAPAPTYCFAISDVPGDDIATIGSGPCVPDPMPVAGVIDILRRASLFDRIAPNFRQYLLGVARGVLPETPKAAHPAFAHVTARVIANNAVALDAAAAAARQAGYDAEIASDPLAGDASAAGSRIAELLVASRARTRPGSTRCVVWGGETTVALGDGAPPGGRCQQLALAASKALAAANGAAAGIALMAAGTDGRDGTTDDAGAVVDATTWGAIGAAGRDADYDLRTHHAHDALAAVGALYSPGLTGTNVMDVVIGLVQG